MKTATKEPKKVVSMRAARTKLGRDCARIQTNYQGTYERGVKLFDGILKGTVDETPAKMAVQALSQTNKAGQVAVQDKHAENNTVKLCNLIANQEREASGFEGSQTELVLGVRSGLETRDASRVKRLIGKRAAA